MKKIQMYGFTLIELMVVVAIIAIFAAIGYPSYQAYILRSSESTAERTLGKYQNEISDEISKIGGSGYFPEERANTSGIDIVYVGGARTASDYRYEIRLGAEKSDGSIVGLSDSGGIIRSWRSLAIPNPAVASVKKGKRYYLSDTERCYEEYPDNNLTLTSGCSVATAITWK